jgi:hypothetical protein
LSIGGAVAVVVGGAASKVFRSQSERVRRSVGYLSATIVGVGVGGVLALVGCSDGGGEDGNGGAMGTAPEPETLLPGAPDGWTAGSTGSLRPPGDAEAGAYGNYVDGNGADREVIALSSNIRWHDHDRIQRAIQQF